MRYFVAVAKELHFGRAAERLHIAQPPLSQQIRQLERELGVELLVRNTRSVAMTPAGQAYYRRVVQILSDVEDAADHARRVDEGVEGHLTIGCVGSATYSLLPSLVRTLGADWPGIDVSVRGELLAPALLTALAAGAIDLALLRPPIRSDGLVVETIRRDRLLVALPAAHRLADRAVLRVDQLADEDFIAHPGRGRSAMNSLLTAICADVGFVPYLRHEVEETSTLITMVAAGLGIAVVPAPTAALRIAGVSYVPLLPEELGIDLVAAHGEQPSPLLDRVISVLKSLV